MRAIRAKDTAGELAVRKALHGEGFRYRLHVKHLPGTPDIVLAKYRAVVFVHGCFWHQHDCPMFKLPKERRSFWTAKLSSNASRDVHVTEQLLAQGWRVAEVWECALKGRQRIPREEVARTLSEWLESELPTLEIRGR